MNYRVLFALVAIVVVLGVSAVAVRYVRKRVVAQQELEAGLAAYAQQDWPEAAKHLKGYLQRRPTDETEDRHVEIPEKYAYALLQIRPLEPEQLGAAISAYRRVLRFDPSRTHVYKELADLYINLRDFEELSYVARKRRENAPDDPKAAIWLATAQIGQRKFAEAREELLPVAENWNAERGEGNDFVLACVMLSGIAGEQRTPEALREALAWLDRAVQQEPQSATAHIQRARFQRNRAASSAVSADALRAAARADLEAASAAESITPQERLLICREWMELGEPQRGLEELAKLEALDDATLAEAFVSLDEWHVAHFLAKTELLLRAERAEEAAALADELFASLDIKQYRLRAMPIAVRAYVRANEIDKARQYLSDLKAAEEIGLVVGAARDSLTLLEAFVLRAEGQPYRVIALLEPLLVHENPEPAVWKVLADAYWETNQNRRAMQVLEEYAKGRNVQDEPEVVLTMAREQLAAGQWNQALQLVEPLSGSDLDADLIGLEARFRIAASQGDAQGLERVAAQATELCEAHPDNVRAHALGASIALAQDDADQAQRLLRSVIDVAEAPQDAELLLVRILARDQKYDEALEVCQAACKREPNAAAMWIAQSEIQTLRDQPDEARAALDAGIAAATNAGEKRELQIQRAIFDLLHNEREAGVARLKTLAAEDSNDLRVRTLLLSLPEIAADRDTAQKLVEELHAIEGETGLLWRLNQAAQLLAGADWQQHVEEAQTLLKHCVRADAGWVEPVLLLGRLYEQLGQYDQAENVYRAALAQNASATRVGERLLRLLQAQKRYAEAQPLLEQLGGSGNVRSSLRVQLLLQSGQIEKAVEELRLQVASNPSELDTHVALARLVFEQTGDATPALKCLDAAEQAVGSSSTITFVRSAILEAAGRNEEARALLDKQVEQSGTFESHFMRAALLAKLGDQKAAEQDLKHLAELPEHPEGPLLLGMFYADQNQLDEALAAWQQGLELYPDDPALKRRIMMALLARNQGDDRQRGLELLTALDQANENDVELMWVRAVVLLSDGTSTSRQQAEALLKRIVELEPTAVDAHLKRIELALQAGDQAGARDMAVLALGANPDEPRVLLARARLERALDNNEAARTMVRLLLKAQPANVDGLELLTELALADATAAGFDEVRAALDHAATQNADEPRLRKTRLVVLEAQGDTAAADALMQELCAAEPNGCVDLWLMLVELNWHLGRLEPFTERLAHVAELAPDSPEALTWQIRGMAVQQQYDEIMSVTTNSPPERLTDEALLTAGGALAGSEQAEHREQALALLERACETTAAGSDVWFAAAGQIFQTGHADRSIELYRKLLEAQPDNARALNDLAWILADAKQDYAAALPLADYGLQLDPDNAHLLDTRGVILSHISGRAEDARRDFERCIALSPANSGNRARILLRLAAVTSELGDQGATQKHLEEALTIDRRLNIFSPEERQQIAALQASGSDGR